ncbi:hypothetical protein [Haladaptatus pallidirubidus]|uniref:hypothetical protein n=1 Tax=Haladaptatus pallidirubidus TaxID=1008152 RepID=UPI001D12DFA2|nr:hypothetical protein [Haladaptatus pallidirubidus]
MPSRFQDCLFRRQRRGFHATALPEAFCGTATGAPIAKRVIANGFQPLSLTHGVNLTVEGGSVTLSRPVGRFTVLTNDANPATGYRTGPWEPSPRNIQDDGFSASRTPVQLPEVDVTLGITQSRCVLSVWVSAMQLPAVTSPSLRDSRPL